MFGKSKDKAQKEVEMDEAAAEAGPGVANTDAVPPNDILDETHNNSRDVSGSDASLDAQPEKRHAQPAHDGPKPLEEQGLGKRAIIMGALCMAVFLAALDVTIITTALPTISEHFHSSAGYTWIGSAYLLANSASTPSWGKISDIFGRKPVLLAANIVFLVGSLVAALANSIGMLIAARAVQGLGGGGLTVLVNICISDLFSLRNRGAYFGIIGGVWAVASAIGPIIGGAFTEKVSWRWCFWINLPLDGIAFLIILVFLDLKTPRTPLLQGLMAIDWVGSLLVVGGTLMFLFGLEYGGVTYPWSSAIVLCLLIFGGFTLVLFFLNEWKFAKYPVMPLRIFKYRSNIACLIVVFVHGAVFIAGSYYLPLYFQAVLGATPLLSGVYLLPTALSLSAGSIGTGVFIKKTGKYLPCIYFGFFFMTLGYGLFCNLYAHSGWAKIIIYQIIAGLGVGPLFQSPLIALQTHIKPRDIATGTATFGFVRQLSTAISVVVGQVIYQNEMQKRSGQLTAVLGATVAQELSGSGAGANTQVVDSLPTAQRDFARTAFADSLHYIWILYVCMSGLGLIVSFGIQKTVLTRQHEETKTGLAAEKENAAAAAQEKADKIEKRKSAATSRASQDVEQGPVPDVPDVPDVPRGSIEKS